MLGNCDGPDM